MKFCCPCASARVAASLCCCRACCCCSWSSCRIEYCCWSCCWSFVSFVSPLAIPPLTASSVALNGEEEDFCWSWAAASWNNTKSKMSHLQIPVSGQRVKEPAEPPSHHCFWAAVIQKHRNIAALAVEEVENPCPIWTRLNLTFPDSYAHCMNHMAGRWMKQKKKAWNVHFKAYMYLTI